MKENNLTRRVSLLFLLTAITISSYGQVTVPVNKAVGINPDAHLLLTFPERPNLKSMGKIRVYDAADDQLVDELDLSIPPGPRNTRTLAPYDSLIYSSIPDKVYTANGPDTSHSHIYQQNFIGGNTPADAFHFYPVIIHGNTAVICLHNHKLDYNKTYYVEVDAAVFAQKNNSFKGITGKKAWTFSTKKLPPSKDAGFYIVSASGDGDFNTVQAAIDFMPDQNPARKVILIRNGTYDEMVYFRNKENITIAGEDREHTIIAYANNGVFNTRLASADPALSRGGHALRQVFGMQNVKGINLVNFTLTSLGEKPAQAEALLALGQQIMVSGVNIDGSGDALQATGSLYIRNSRIQGYGDNVLGYGAVFFDHCDFVSTFGPHLWVRNTQTNHGDVLLNCTLRTIGNNVETDIARAPNSGGATFPYVEAVLINCRLQGVRPGGWGKTADQTKDIRYWEFNSTDATGKPADITKRNPVSRQLTMEKDQALISDYSKPAFILGGWTPDTTLLDVPFVDAVNRQKK